ncbi:MAG: LptF/LptG family permease, partial [Planctomycetota bacterium]|nr:LptF/LptG family permease [Planctomycetota bacterium]
GPRFVVNPGKDKPIVTLSAESAFFKTYPNEEKLTLELKNGSWDREGKLQLRFEDEFQWDLSLTDLTRKSKERNKPSDLPLAVIANELEKQITETQLQKEQNAVSALLQLTTGSIHELKTSNWKLKTDDLQKNIERVNRLRTEPYRRWANGFSCLGFAVLGVPLSIWMRNSDMWTSFGLCFVPTLVVYIPLMLFSVERAKNGSLHPCIVWIGNIVILLIGVFLFKRALKY